MKYLYTKTIHLDLQTRIHHGSCYITLVELHILSGFCTDCGVFPHDIVVHDSGASEQGETARTAQYTSYHVFCGLLEPVSDGIFKPLIPYHRTCNSTSGSTIHTANTISCTAIFSIVVIIKIEYIAVGETWWQPLLSYGK